MAIQLDIFLAQRLIFGFWNQNGDKYYFGHIADGTNQGVVETEHKKGTKDKRLYNILDSPDGLLLHISNFQFSIQTLNEKEMHIWGPLPAGVLMKYEKIPNKITYSM